MENTKHFRLSTRGFADRNGVMPGTVRARLYARGDYFGIQPVRLANGRLMWPDTAVVRDADCGKAA